MNSAKLSPAGTHLQGYSSASYDQLVAARDALAALRQNADQRDFDKGEEHYDEDTSELSRNALDSWYGTWHSGGW